MCSILLAVTNLADFGALSGTTSFRELFRSDSLGSELVLNSHSIFVMRSLAIVCLLLYVSAGFANPECSTHLTNSPVTMSEHGKAYLRLIDHFAERAGNFSKGLVIYRALKSDFTLNVFDIDYPDSFLHQLKEAVDRLLPRLSEDDWALIRAAVQMRVSRWRSEHRDRQEKSIQTQAVFLPRIANSFKLPWESGDVADSPSWQNVNGRNLLAVSAVRGGIAVYERIGEKIVMIAESGDKVDVTSSVSWHVDGDRVFLSVSAYASKGHGIYWIELVGKKLVYGRVINGLEGHVDHPPICHLVGQDKYCAVITTARVIYLFRVVNGLLSKVRDGAIYGRLGFASGWAPRWHERDGSHYLINSNPAFDPVYKLVGERIVAVGPEEMEKVLEYRVEFGEWKASTDWRAHRHYLAATGLKNSVEVFEIVDGKTRVMNTESISADCPLIAWVPVEDRDILVVGDRSGLLRYFEVYELTVSEINRIYLNSGISSIDTWHRDGDEIYQIVGTPNAQMHLLKLFN